MGIEADSNLADYARLLAEWPGLVGRGEDPAALVEDSLVLLPHLGDATTLVDVGSGGGMPGIPLALARPELRVTLVEADARKSAFLEHAAARLGLDLRVLNERAEVVGQGPLRESFDAACCRALAALPVALELCLPLVRVGGRLLALTTETEVAGAELVGGGPAQVVPAPSRLRAHGLVVVVQKIAPTPAAFPRRPGVPSRRPLGT